MQRNKVFVARSATCIHACMCIYAHVGQRVKFIDAEVMVSGFMITAGYQTMSDHIWESFREKGPSVYYKKA